MIVATLLFACTTVRSPADDQTTDDSVDSGEPDVCRAATYTGEVVGEDACVSGICDIPSGPFWMGSDSVAHPDECPARRVELSSYRIDQTEVTRSAWGTCVDAGACAEVPARCVSEAHEDDPNHAAVMCVDWAAAANYCAFVGGRLPTEAEWEKAARGTDGATWAWGREPPTCNSANFHYASSYCELGVVAVGSYPERKSAFGLWDTVGNAWEWVADWYDAEWYSGVEDGDPQGPTGEACHDVRGGVELPCHLRVTRGGAYNATEQNTRAATRAPAAPNIIDVNLGFRCAYDP